MVAALTVDDFSKLLSKENLLPLIIFSILLGVAINMVGEKGKKVASALDTLTEVMMKLVQVVMYTAPRLWRRTVRPRRPRDPRTDCRDSLEI